jgi:hypothetical protein
MSWRGSLSTGDRSDETFLMIRIGSDLFDDEGDAFDDFVQVRIRKWDKKALKAEGAKLLDIADKFKKAY